MKDSSPPPVFDRCVERRRLSFILERDGALAAIAYAKAMKLLYLKAARTRKAFSKHDNYRWLYVEAAYSFRFLIDKI